MPDSCLTLARTENQALALGRFATDFLAGRYGEPGDRPIQRVEQFHLDSVACAVSAIACGTNAPGVLRREAFSYPASDPSRGATCFGSTLRVMPEKAVAANCAAVREWDANGTNFGYRPELGHTRGEFGHNDYYPVIIAAAQVAGADGPTVLRGMLLVDEIRGRLAEVFSLRAHKIDHVVHGAIASAVVYGAMVGASAEQIESAVGLVVAHYIPFRAIRAGEQLSDSKGASAALAAEMAVLSVRRAVAGFVGPGDIFRNPQAIFCLYEKPARQGKSPFDLTLTVAGDDFAVMGMHFKLGLYEHQAAGAIQGLLDVLAAEPRFLHDPGQLRAVRITIYEPAFGIIGDPAKRNPRTRQSADHSMVYIIGTLLRKAFEQGSADWRELMLMPEDYSDAAIFNPLTRSLMERIEFRHGGPEYDAQYPDGLPTTVELEHAELGRHSSGLVLYPTGHARNTSADLAGLLAYKFQRLAAHGVTDVAGLQRRISGMQQKTAAEIDAIYDFQMFGLLNLDKPRGLTSREVVNRVQRLVRPAKVGHTGTLDPLASGVLVVCVGPATRLVEYVQRMRKKYRATFLLGRTSATEDIEGEVTVLDDAPQPTRAEVERAAAALVGEIEQRPPVFSALKVRGRRACDLARRGHDLALAPRPIMVYRIDIERFDYPELVLDIECGGGTYVRSLGRDLAESLGSGAVMSELVRTAVGGFSQQEARPIDQLSVATLSAWLLPPVEALGSMPRMVLVDSILERVGRGQEIQIDLANERRVAAMDASGHLRAIVERKDDGAWWPVVNFPAGAS